MVETMNKKATFVLPQSLLQELRRVVEAGQAESVSALVRESVEARLRELREERLRREFCEAAQDPLFMADMEQVARDFAEAEGDGLE